MHLCQCVSITRNSAVQVYEYASLLDDGGSGATGGAHYPVLDLPFRSKLAAVAWCVATACSHWLALSCHTVSTRRHLPIAEKVHMLCRTGVACFDL